LRKDLFIYVEENNKSIIRIFSAAFIVIAISIGNIINYQGITIYKVVSVLGIVIFLIFWLLKPLKIDWNVFFILFSIFILANICMFGVLKNPHPLKQKLLFIGRLVMHGLVLFIFFNLVIKLKIEWYDRILLSVLYVSSFLNIIATLLQAVDNSFLPLHLHALKYRLYIRTTGLFMDPNYNGFFISSCIFLTFFLYRGSVVNKRSFYLLFIPNIICRG